MGRNSRRRRERREHNQMHRMTPENRGRGIWVFSDWIPDGRYGATVTYGEDHSWPLDDPIRYAADVARVAVTAEHDAAFVRCAVHTLKLPMNVLGALMRALRGDRVDRPDVEVLPGLWLTPGVNMEYKPFVSIRVKGGEPSQVDASDLLIHAHAALSTGVAAELDTNVRTTLTGPAMELDDDTASMMVAALTDHWPGRQSA
jgi:hypothetical protein